MELETTLQTRALRSQARAARAIELADIVGGGDGHGSGKSVAALTRAAAKLNRQTRLLGGAKTNQFARAAQHFVDGVVIPDGGGDGKGRSDLRKA